MSVTININGLSLCHKSSGGISTATVPDVCKTPPNSLPVPYPNIAFSRDLAKGTTTVTADGGNKCANYGSEFSKSTGDEPGTLGGVKSGTFMKEATWITHSFDVKLEGKGACRLTDKMFHNQQNTVNMGGLLQAPIDAWPELVELCLIICQCDKTPEKSTSGKSKLKQNCVKNALNAAHELGMNENMRPEIPYDMTPWPASPPTPLLHRVPGGTTLDPTDYLSKRMEQEGLLSAGGNDDVYQVRKPDVVISRAISSDPARAASSLTAPNLKAVVEVKFNKQARDPEQILDYQKIAGDPNLVVELNPEECMCREPDPKPVLVHALEEERERRRRVAAEPVVVQPLPQPVPAGGGFLDTMSKATGLTGGALILYLIVSEGSRAFPPRNLVPAP